MSDFMQTASRLRIGLIANRAHQDAADSALVRLFTAGGAAIAQLHIDWIIVGRTLDAINTHGLTHHCARFERFPYGREGGLMKLVARVVDSQPQTAIDAVIYLIDPVDPSSIFPEAQALKRQCVIHGKPFLSTLASALEWLNLEAAALKQNDGLDQFAALGSNEESIALIAHDALKTSMLQLAEKHFAILDRFAYRYATGTTGGLLNQLAQGLKKSTTSSDVPNTSPWVQAFLSGPLGGDAQLAELVLDKKIRRILFLEDPHVARQHEADIQLLERAARTVTDFAIVVSDVKSADRWLSLLGKRKAD